MPDSDVLTIGEYQLRNLLAQRVHFHLLNLAAENEPSSHHELLKTGVRVAPENVLKHVREAAIPANDPIILVCADGKVSSAQAVQLEQNSFINVYVVSGGSRTL